jgi:Domain of unknown function (DUF4249)
MALNFKLVLCSVLCLFLNLRCEKERVFEPENLPDVLFVNGQIDPNFGADILVTKAVSTSDTVLISSLLLRDAAVFIVQEGGIRRQVPHKKDGRYLLGPAGLDLKAGEKYRIEVSVPGLPEVVSEWVRIPDLILADSLGLRLDGGLNGNSPTAEGRLVFQDQKTGRDHYYLGFTGQIDPLTPIPNNFSFKAAQVCEIQSGSGCVGFDDTCLGSETKAVFQINSDVSIYLPDKGQSFVFQAVTLRFGKSSPEFQEYLSSLAQPEEWENGLIEPKPTYTNIKDGFGVFFATHTTAKTIKL